MDIDNIFSFQINQKTYNNYFRLIDLEETIVHKILGYFDNVQNKIMFLYQTENKIKFFIMDNKEEIYSLSALTDTLQVYSFQSNVQYDLNNLFTNPLLSNLGNLNVEQIKYKINALSYEYQYFGKDFDQLIMQDNILIPEPSLNDWKTYNLSFIEKVEGQYIRIYHLASLTKNIETCKTGCITCFQSYDTCTDCSQSGFASLEDKPEECYPSTYLVEEYIYDQSSNKFLKYSFVNLGDCEKKIISYYNLPENTELFILGIDSPNKDILSSSNVFNYGVYLQNGTLLDHKEACKDTKITISTPITNPDLIKLKEAVYFSDMGYDIFDENSDFYKDQCSPASIDGNDINLIDLV